MDDWRLKEMLHLPSLRMFFTLSHDSSIRTLYLVDSHAFFTARSAAVSDTVLAINTILLQFINFLAHGVGGFAFAAESFVEKYKGAGLIDELEGTVRYSFLWALALGVGLSVIFGLFGPKLLNLFTNKADIVAQSLPYLIWKR